MPVATVEKGLEEKGKELLEKISGGTEKPDKLKEISESFKSKLQELPLFILRYRYAQMVREKTFLADNPETATETAQFHCRSMHYKFISCRAFISDLKAEERAFAAGEVDPAKFY